MPLVPSSSKGGGSSSPLTTKGDVWGYSTVDARIPVGTNGQMLTAASGQALGVQYTTPPGFEIGYTQITAGVNVVSTTEATGTTIISPGALTFDGAPVIVTFFGGIKTPTAAAGNATVVCLFESTTQITELGNVVTPAAAQTQVWSTFTYRFTPTAGSHTYTITAFATTTTGTPQINAGAGGTGANPPAFVRFTKV